MIDKFHNIPGVSENTTPCLGGGGHTFKIIACFIRYHRNVTSRVYSELKILKQGAGKIKESRNNRKVSLLFIYNKQ